MNTERKTVYLLLGVEILILGLCFALGGYIPEPVLNGGALLSMAGVALSQEELKQLENALTRKAGEVIDYVKEQVGEVKTRMLDLEQKAAHRGGAMLGSIDSGNAIGELANLIVKDAGVQGFQRGARAPVEIKVSKALFKTAIINATGQNQPLVQADRRPSVVAAPQRRFTIRDLFEQIPTSSNVIEVAKESTFTNNAGPQFNSPNDRENVVKAESAFSFTLENVNLVTIAHWVPASRQILSDAPLLEAYLSGRLLYGLKMEEEEQFLTGDGTGGNISGLWTNKTAYDQGVSNDTRIDCLAKSMAQLMASEYQPTGFILNPTDWFRIILTKDTQGRYLFGDPQMMAEPRLWGLPVVVTNAMTAGNFLTIDAARAGYVADREEATVRIAEQHEDFFVRNMVAILCEERTTLVIQQAGAIVGGALPATGT